MSSLSAAALPGTDRRGDDSQGLGAELRVGSLWNQQPIGPHDDGDLGGIRIGRCGDLQPHLAPVGAMADHSIPVRLGMVGGQPATLAHQALTWRDTWSANRGRGAVLPCVSRSMWHLGAPKAHSLRFTWLLRFRFEDVRSTD